MAAEQLALGWLGEVRLVRNQPSSRSGYGTRLGAQDYRMPGGGNRQSGRCENTDDRPLLGMRDLFA
ncbi:hypothetical protein [Snodgrassella sp. ESL0253]|uniref:hypothetical protein n=1 Tax=Snodgrassella sp. ESL0253 TaxID=2705031 RepID=UPI001583CEFB|nr:hypothetical protein [Snodgrassella sp. ESL0253]NUE66597.1 hypothetical protein [Snodgrassella sp. ESL0253]